MNFVVKGTMLGGFALAAAPADYQVTGVRSFIVGPSGIVDREDLEPEALMVFQNLDRSLPES
jgi:Protein of unknown function (DUF2950)